MFRDDQMEIEMSAARSPQNTLDVGTFVLLTIRQQFSGVGRQLDRVRAGDARPLWGFKYDGYRYLCEKRDYLHKRAHDCRMGRIWVNDLMRDYLAVPGLGLVKAGFAVQLLTGEAGCFDMHNVDRFGLNATDFKIGKRTDPDAQLREIDSVVEWYLALCDDYGGSEMLWDGWCHHVAEQYRTWDSAEQVSRAHVNFLKGEPA